MYSSVHTCGFDGGVGVALRDDAEHSGGIRPPRCVPNESRRIVHEYPREFDAPSYLAGIQPFNRCAQRSRPQSIVTLVVTVPPMLNVR